MIIRFLKRKGLGKDRSMIEPDEIFLDSKNIQNFDRQQFEGRIEKAISKRTIIFAARGIIYDRAGVELAWNKKTAETELPIRSYLSPGFAHVLGYISYPAK